MTDFIIPDFLQEKSPEELHKKMIAAIPEDIDLSEGQLAHDLTYPAALVVSELAQADLPRIISQIWPQFATGENLDYHAVTRKMERKAAQAATGKLLITGQDGFLIPAGSRFSTVSRTDNIAVEFATVQNYVITDGSVLADVKAVEAGSDSNAAANTVIIVLSDNLNGIDSVTNPEPIDGGYNEEADEELRKRIIQYDQSISGSYIGNENDYRRWALSVVGVGDVTVMPAGDETGLVTIIATDSNGSPASAALCQDIYDYIMEGKNELGIRYAPVNANLAVIPPTGVLVTIAGEVDLDGSNALSEVKTEFMDAAKLYFQQAMVDGEIKYSAICRLLSTTAGVYDIRNIFIDGGRQNIKLPKDYLPVLEASSVVLTEGVL